MLYLIGIGLKPKHLTLEALEAIRECDAVFLENYTSKYSEGAVKELEELIGKKVTLLGRQHVEEQSHEFLAMAERNRIAFLVHGNVFSATTHSQLAMDAKKNGVKMKFIPGISVFSYLGKTGLDEYRFGRTTTIVSPKENFAPESFYDAIEKNQAMGLHTLCLLDIDLEENRLMSAKEAIELLLAIERKRKKSIVKKSLLILVAGAGSEKEKIAAGRAEELLKCRANAFPQSLIVCGKLTAKEKEVLKEFYGKC
ncbi:MAG: diphthine synthase [Candidatus Diapherotrites archaeon]